MGKIKITFKVVSVMLLLQSVAFAQNFQFIQKRFQMTYSREGHHQTLRLKGSIIVSKNESADSFLTVLKNKVEPGIDTLFVMDIFGGDLAVVNKVYDILRGKCHDRGYQSCKLTTEVEMFRTCASACIPLFMVGDVRKAAERSDWGFHQAAMPGGLIMIPFMSEYVLRTKNVNSDWLKKNKKMFKSLKVTWLQPASLKGSNIVTQIISHPQ